MPSVSYDLALEILFRLFNPGGRALKLRRIQAVDFGVCYLEHLKYSTDNPKKAAELHRRTLNNAKNTHNCPLSECIITPGGAWNKEKRRWLEELLNISSVLTGLRDEVQLELFDEAETAPVPDKRGPIPRPAFQDGDEGEEVSIGELEIW